MNQTITHNYLRNLFDNLSEDNFEDFLVELQFSTLIVPVNDYDGVPIIEFNGNQFMPLFTDIYEFDRFNKNDEFIAVDHDFNYYLELLIDKKVHAIIINPDSEKIPITEEMLDFIKPNYIFEQDYQLFTANEIRRIKDSISNDELNEFLKDESNLWDLDMLVEKLNDAKLLTMLMSNEDFSEKAEDGVISIPLTSRIPQCLYGMWGKNYLLLFSRDVTQDTLPDDTVFKYTQIVNFPLLVQSALNHDFDGFILNVNEENVIIPRENLRNFIKDFNNPLLDDYSMYAFLIPEGD